jgi:hypothetical protein
MPGPVAGELAGAGAWRSKFQYDQNIGGEITRGVVVERKLLVMRKYRGEQTVELLVLGFEEDQFSISLLVLYHAR